MTDDDKKPANQPLNEGYQPYAKGFTPSPSERVIAQDGFTPTAGVAPGSPPAKVPQTTTSVQSPKKDS